MGVLKVSGGGVEGGGREWVFKQLNPFANSTFTKIKFSRNVTSYVSLPPNKENKSFWTALKLYLSLNIKILDFILYLHLSL